MQVVKTAQQVAADHGGLVDDRAREGTRFSRVSSARASGSASGLRRRQARCTSALASSLLTTGVPACGANQLSRAALGLVDDDLWARPQPAEVFALLVAGRAGARQSL